MARFNWDCWRSHRPTASRLDVFAALSLADHMRCGRSKGLSCLDGVIVIFLRVSVVPAVFVVVTLSTNVGRMRAWVTASNPEASLINVGSLKAVPRKLMPTGIPSAVPDGTCTMGYPGPPASPELAKMK